MDGSFHIDVSTSPAQGSPARGIVMGVLISAVLWALIALVVTLIIRA